MKKKSIVLLSIFTLSFASAQTWSENFSFCSVPGLSAGWAGANAGTVSFGCGTRAWESSDYHVKDPLHGTCMVSTSQKSSAGISDDWLITPSFSVPVNAAMQWEDLTQNQRWADGYRVLISTTGTNTANFTTCLMTVESEKSIWTTRFMDLSDYAGQTVNIAFVNNSSDRCLLLLDNVKVFAPELNDGRVSEIAGLLGYIAEAGNQNISGTFVSAGVAPTRNAVLNYQLNNGPVVTEKVDFATPLNYGETYHYSFNTRAITVVGPNKIKVWVSSVNNVNEGNFVNDTAYASFVVASKTVPRNGLIEEFSSSSCEPCAELAVTEGFDTLLNSYNPNKGGNLCVVKYQMNWPDFTNDPSYSEQCWNRRGHYDLWAIPWAIANGTTTMQNHNQTEIDAAIAVPAYADITATLAAIGSTNASANTTLAASATITPYVSFPSNSPLRVFQVITQHAYTYSAAITLQKDYYHVMRKMNPDAWGTPTVVTDGVPFVVNFNHIASTAPCDPTPAQQSFNFWTSGTITPNDIVYEYVVFLQDTTNNQVLQASSWTASVTIPDVSPSVGIHQQSACSKTSVYPNPAKEYAVVSVEIEKLTLVEVTIFNGEGKQVYTNRKTSLGSGKHDLKINTSEFAKGNYNITINLNGEILNKQLIITK